MCYRAQHLWQAAAKQSPCVPAAVSVRVMGDGTEGRQELELAAAHCACQAGRWALQRAMLTLWVGGLCREPSDPVGTLRALGFLGEEGSHRALD